MKHEPLDLSMLLHVPYVDPYHDFDMSPDGNLLAFSWNKTGQWEIFLLDLGTPSRIQKLTSGPGGKFAPRFSPGGEMLAYILDADGSEEYDIFSCNLASGEHTNLTPHTPEAIQPNFCWSPDGRQLAYLSDRSGHFCPYILPITGGEGKMILDIPTPAWEICWSSDGRWLAVCSEGRGQEHLIHLIPIAGGQARLLELEGKSLNAQDPQWSMDGKRLAFSGEKQDNHQIGIYEPATNQIAWLTTSPGEKSSPTWSPDGARLAYVCTLGAETWVETKGISEAGEFPDSRSQFNPGVCFWPHFTSDGCNVVMIFVSPKQPPDLWLLSSQSGEARQLTNSLPADIPRERLVQPAEVRYPGMDGVDIPALLFVPPEVHTPSGMDSHSPAVVVIHGGPSWLYQFGWFPQFQHMVSRGWVVLAPNYRGSTGYGREWQLANRFDLGGVDTRDVVAGADYLKNTGLADPGRIAVTGRSHGGYLTMTCLTQYPDRWAAGSAIVPFLNWFTSHENSREDLQHWDIENMGDPIENHALWYERSPFFFLDRIQSPVQLICGANDPRCPASESIEARDRLKSLGKEVDFVVYADEGHGFLKIENVVDHELRRVEFLAQVLEGKSS